MTVGRFRGWFTRAYPSVKFYEQSQSLVFLSDNRKDIQCIIKDSINFTFPSLMPDHAFVTDDYHIVLYCMILWGTPKLEYRFTIDPKAPIRTPRGIRDLQPIPKKAQTSSPKLVITATGIKGDILKDLESHYQGLETISIPGGSVEVVVDNHHGPVLYDYGLTPGVTKGHLFVPYSHWTDVQKILEDFKNSLR